MRITDPVYEGGRWLQQDTAALARFFRVRGVRDSEDLVQATLLGLFEGRDRFRGDASARTYLFAIARFQLHSYRRELRRASVVVSGDHLEGEGAHSLSGKVGDELRMRLMRAIPRLSRKSRVVLKLSFWEGLSHPEIAARLAVPIGTVASRIRLAKQRLGRELRRLDGGFDR